MTTLELISHINQIRNELEDMLDNIITIQQMLGDDENADM